MIRDPARGLWEIHPIVARPLAHAGHELDVVGVRAAVVPDDTSQGPLEGLAVAGPQGFPEDVFHGLPQRHGRGTARGRKKTAYVFLSQTFRKLRKMS